MNIVVIALGGAMGSVIRYLMMTSIQNRFNQFHQGFPLGTLAVNVLGSFLIGLLFIVIQQRFHSSELLRGFLIIGLLGGFTTFSAFSFETLHLLESGFWGKAFLNIISSIFFCIASAFAGIEFGRWLTST